MQHRSAHTATTKMYVRCQSRGRSRWVSEFKASQGYTEKPCLERPKKEKEKKKESWFPGGSWGVDMSSNCAFYAAMNIHVRGQHCKHVKEVRH